MELPPAAELVELVRRHGPHALDVFAPDIDRLADTAEVARWLGLRRATIYREQSRPRSDGRTWPAPDAVFGRTRVWKLRTVIEYRASQPGPGRWRLAAEPVMDVHERPVIQVGVLP